MGYAIGIQWQTVHQDVNEQNGQFQCLLAHLTETVQSKNQVQKLRIVTKKLLTRVKENSWRQKLTKESTHLKSSNRNWLFGPATALSSVGCGGTRRKFWLLPTNVSKLWKYWQISQSFNSLYINLHIKHQPIRWKFFWVANELAKKLMRSKTNSQNARTGTVFY